MYPLEIWGRNCCYFLFPSMFLLLFPVANVFWCLPWPSWLLGGMFCLFLTQRLGRIVLFYCENLIIAKEEKSGKSTVYNFMQPVISQLEEILFLSGSIEELKTAQRAAMKKLIWQFRNVNRVRVKYDDCMEVVSYLS